MWSEASINPHFQLTRTNGAQIALLAYLSHQPPTHKYKFCGRSVVGKISVLAEEAILVGKLVAGYVSPPL